MPMAHIIIPFLSFTYILKKLNDLQTNYVLKSLMNIKLVFTVFIPS